jgi:chromate transporter
MNEPASGGEATVPPTLGTVLHQWGRLGCIGFGGPPTHIKLLRELCVERRQWLDPQEFEDAIAACNLLPGPASTQLAIFCAWRVRGRAGAIIGGLAFIVPGLTMILALSALFLEGAPPHWVLGAGAGAGAAVAAVAAHAAMTLVQPSWTRHPNHHRWIAYLFAGIAASALLGPWVVVVLIACGLIELAARNLAHRKSNGDHARLIPILATAALTLGTLAQVAWVALKVGALSYGGGFVIVPLMQHDAVDTYHWLTAGQFLNAVALGQITPGPVVQTVAAVGYGAGGLLWACWPPLLRSHRHLCLSSSAHATSTCCVATNELPVSSVVPDRPRSEPSSALRSHSPERSAKAGNTGYSPPQPSSCSCCAAAQC